MVLLIAIAACSGRVSVFIYRIIFITSKLGCIPNFAADHFLFVLCCAHHIQQPLLVPGHKQLSGQYVQFGHIWRCLGDSLPVIAVL